MNIEMKKVMRNMQKVACGTRQELLLKPRWQTCPIEIHLLVSVASSCVCKSTTCVFTL